MGKKEKSEEEELEPVALRALSPSLEKGGKGKGSLTDAKNCLFDFVQFFYYLL
jgi:hypothetical protein